MRLCGLLFRDLCVSPNVFKNAGGNITINAPKVQISDGGSLRAETQSAFSGGNITVNAQTIDINSGGKILTSALGSGDAGNTILNATKQITISGSNSDISDTFKRNQHEKSTF